METRSRRIPRAAGPTDAPAEPIEPVEISAAAGRPTEPATQSPEPHKPDGLLAEAATPAETALELVTAAAASAARPSVESFAQEAQGTFTKETALFGRDAFAALAQSQTALTRGLGALSAEIAGLALSAIDTAARTATKMLGVKTLSDAIEVNAGFTCSSLDALIGGSAKLSELGVKLAAETSGPLLNQLGKSWSTGSRRNS